MATTDSATVQRKLTAILSADVKGYSRLMGEDEVATIRTLTAYREVMTTLIQQQHGRVVDSPGDNMLAEFASVIDAVQCAVAIQCELKSRNADLPDSRKMEFRIGINVGDVIVEGERIYGDGVNIAARLEGLAEPGGMCISGVVYDQIENKLPDLTLTYESLGEQTVKNIAKPVTAYRVVIAAAAVSDVGASPKPVLSLAKGGRPDIPPGQPHGVAPTTMHPTLSLPDKPSIAVLPFANLSNDPEQEYFSDGITEDLITDLSKLSGLFVISRNSAFLYKGKTVKPEHVGQQLGVRYMLEGSVRKAANRVRITAQLVDVTTGYHLWADRYDRELQDIFAVQDEVTHKIVSALEVKLTEGEQGRLGRPITTNLDAYEYFLRGLEFYAHRTKESHLQAQRMFQQAVELDPQFAAAYAWLGRTYVVEWWFRWSENGQSLEQAFTLAQRALALDDALPGAYQTLSYVYLARKQRQLAAHAAEKATMLDPNDADAALTQAEVWSCTGRVQEALPLIEKAMRLNPHYPASYVFVLGQIYYLTGRHEEAIAAFQRVLTRNPEHLSAHFFLAIIYGELGRREEAQVELRRCGQSSPVDSPENVLERVPLYDEALRKRWVSVLRDIWP